MRLIASFFLALISYIFILSFLYFVFLKKEKKQVLIHHAVIVPKIEVPKKDIKASVKKAPKVVKKSVKKSGSKSNMTKGGKVDFNDIFKNVNYSVPTKKVNLKKEPILSRYKANNILKKLKNVKLLNVNISFETKAPVKKEKLDEIIEKIGKVWYEISDIAGEYATIKFINNNGKVEAYILDSNLDKTKEARLLEELKRIKFDKNIDLTVKFQTKVSK